MKLNAIIIDDEKNSQEAIKNLVEQYCSDIRIIAVADSLLTGIAAINKYKPNLILLDIEMPQESGLKIFNYFPEPSFDIIFITAYNKYAVQAFRLSAIDYLLKPLDIEELKEAIHKAKKKRANINTKQRYEALKSNLNNIQSKLTLPSKEGYIIVNIKDIIRCEAQGNYTVFYTFKGEKIIVSKTLRIYEEMLPMDSFFRANRSNIINLNFIKSYNKLKAIGVMMKDGFLIQLAETKREEFLKKVLG